MLGSTWTASPAKQGLRPKAPKIENRGPNSKRPAPPKNTETHEQKANAEGASGFAVVKKPKCKPKKRTRCSPNVPKGTACNQRLEDTSGQKCDPQHHQLNGVVKNRVGGQLRPFTLHPLANAGFWGVRIFGRSSKFR